MRIGHTTSRADGRSWRRISLASSVTVATTVILMSTPSVSQAAPSQSLQPSASPADWLAYQASFRQELGFESDSAHLARVNESGTLSQIANIPVTVAEEQELGRRNTLALAVPAIVNLSIDNSTFGGAWLDNINGGLLRIVFTESPPQAVLDTINSLTPAGYPAAVISIVGYSHVSLSTVANDMLSASDPLISTVWVDQSNNSVIVGVPTDAPADAELDSS